MAKRPELFQKYDGSSTSHQRGTRAGMVRPGNVIIQDPFRSQVMLGPHLEPDNPLTAYHSSQVYLPNPSIGEFPELVPTAEAYLELQSEHDLIIAESLERTLELPRGFFAARLVWGNYFFRGLDYQVQGKVKDKRVVDEINVRGKKVDGVTVYDIETDKGLKRMLL